MDMNEEIRAIECEQEQINSYVDELLELVEQMEDFRLDTDEAMGKVCAAMDRWIELEDEKEDILNGTIRLLTVDETVAVWLRSHEEDVLIAAERHTRDEFVSNIRENIEEYLGQDERVSERVMAEAEAEIVRICDTCLVGQFKTK